MFCTKCGTKNEDGAKFCHSCGNMLDKVQAEDSAQTAGYTDYIQNYNRPETESVMQKDGQFFNRIFKSRNGHIISLSLAPAIILLTVIIVLSTRGGGVLNPILKAAENTLKAGSCEFSIKYEGTYNNYRPESDEMEGVLIYNLEEEDIAFDISYDDERSVLYDEVLYYFEDDEIWHSEDLSRELDDLYDYYDDYKASLSDLSDLDLEEVMDEAGLDRFVEMDELSGCFKTFLKNLNDRKYFEKVCNDFKIKKSGGASTYSFDVDVPELVESLLDTFSPAIDYDLEDIEDELLDEAEEIEELLLEITIRDSKLAEVMLEYTVDDGYDVESTAITMKAGKYGKAVIDEDEIEDMIEDMIDRRY